MKGIRLAFSLVLLFTIPRLGTSTYLIILIITLHTSLLVAVLMTRIKREVYIYCMFS